MQCPPILSIKCQCQEKTHDNATYDLRSIDNMLVKTIGVSDGELHRDIDEIPVIVLDVSGDQYVGEAHASSETIVDQHRAVVMIPLSLMLALVDPLNETIALAECHSE